MSLKTILIVDDSSINVTLLREILKKAHPDYKIISSDGGRGALDLIRDNKPDIILLDVMMPDIDGFDICSTLKNNIEYKDIPVLLITALDNIEDKIRGFKVGAADYIVKPINAEETIARVDSHLSIKIYQDELKDINEKLKNAQEALIDSAKMSAVGSLSAGISHEFNNVLTMMDGHVKLSKRSNDIKDLKETMDIVDSLIQRSKKIINGLLSFSRGDKNSEMVSADVREVIEQDLVFMKKMLADGKVRITREYSEVSNILCHPNQLSQVFVNILKNAIDALNGRQNRDIKISIYEVMRESLSDYVKHKMEDIIEKTDKFLVIRFDDNGPGISEDIKNKIFEPFVTTKGVLHGGNTTTPGTGLGLSIAFGIISRHHGVIHIDSKLDKGTAFIITLPIID